MNLPEQNQSLKKLKKRINQPVGCLILSLDHINTKFQSSSTRVTKLHRKLHNVKSILHQRCLEFQKLEREMKENIVHYRHSLAELEMEMQNIGEVRDVLCDTEKQDIHFAQADILKTKNQITVLEQELNQEKMIVSRKIDSNRDEPSSSEVAVPFRIVLPNIDPTGFITKEGHFKLDYNRKCCICLRNEIDILFQECGHHCCCSTCAQEIIENKQKCPICDVLPKKKLKMYFM